MRESNLQNKRLDKIYSIIDHSTPEVRWINYSDELLWADENHKWGPSPYHFGDEFYQAQRKGIRAAMMEPPVASPTADEYVSPVRGIELKSNLSLSSRVSLSRVVLRLLISADCNVDLHNALVSFDLKDENGNSISSGMQIPGLMLSHIREIGWFVYVRTFPGVNIWKRTVELPLGVSCERVTLHRWGEGAARLSVLEAEISNS